MECDYYVDVEESIWRRYFFTVEGETQEECDKQAEEMTVEHTYPTECNKLMIETAEETGIHECFRQNNKGDKLIYSSV